MNYNTSILIMTLIIMGGLYFNPIVGGVLLLGAMFAVFCTWQRRRL